MTGDEIKALRKELGCTARELASVLEVDQATVLAWERAELFPTKRHVDRMAALRAAGPGAVPRHPARAKQPTNAGPMQALRDPALWEVVRKLIAHDKLRADVVRLAAGYPDPSDD